MKSKMGIENIDNDKLQETIKELRKPIRQKLEEKCREKFFQILDNRKCHCGGDIGYYVEDYVEGYGGNPNIFGPGGRDKHWEIKQKTSEIHCNKCKIKYYE